MSSRDPRGPAVARLERSLRALSEQDSLHGQAVASRLGINATDLDALRLLLAESATTAGALADRLGLTSGAITGVLDRLEKAGLAERRRDPADRRQVIVEASREHPELKQLIQATAGALAPLTAALSESQLSAFADLLERTRDNLRDETARLRGSGHGPGELSAPLGSLQRCKLRFASGVSNLDLRGGAPAGELYRARFEGRAPEVKLRGGQLTVKHPGFSLLDWRRSGASYRLSPAIPWDVELSGGTSRMRADLSEVDVRSLSFSGGASDVEVHLPRPHGAVPLRITGGASSITLRRPSGVPVQLTLLGGASRLTLDAQQLGAIGGRAVLQTPDLPGARDRFEIDVTGGASSISVLPEGAK